MDKIDLLVYHENCPDGVAAAWIAKRYLSVKEDMHLRAGSDVPLCENKTILFVDFCSPFPNIVDLVKKNNKIIVMDHHKSAIDMFASNKSLENVVLHLDIKKSGCQIVWDILTGGKERPWFIDYIGDKDLWQWKLENSKFINLALFADGDMSFEKMDDLLKVNDDFKNKLVEKGKIIDEINQVELNHAIKNASLVKFMDTNYTVLLSSCKSSNAGNLSSILRKI